MTDSTSKKRVSRRSNRRGDNHVSHRDLVKALKIAYCYMPEDEEINAKNYQSDQLDAVKSEVSKIRDVFSKLGIAHDKIYEEVNRIN